MIDYAKLWRQIKVLVRANLKSRYRKTIAGFFWVVFNPIIIFGVQSQVFSKFLRLDVPNYYLFLLSGLLPWIFILQTLEMCTSIFVANGQLLKSFPAHPIVYLMAQILDNAINFAAAFVLLLVPVWLYQPSNPIGLMMLFLPCITLVLAVVGMAWFLATLQVFFRDTRFIVTFVMNISFFLTPVFYPVEYVPAEYRWLVVFNPFYRLIEPFRIALYEFAWEPFGVAMVKALGVAVLSLGLATYYWRSKRNALYFNI